MPRSEGPPLKALANGATCTVQTYKNSVNSSVKATKKMATVISKIQMSDHGPSWPSRSLFPQHFISKVDFLSYNIVPSANVVNLRTFWEKEKIEVTSIFSFNHNVFYSVRQI